MKHKTRIYFDDFVNAVHNCDRRSQFCERRSQFSIVNVGATPRGRVYFQGKKSMFIHLYKARVNTLLIVIYMYSAGHNGKKH